MSTNLWQSNNPIYRRRLIQHRVGIFLSISAMAIGLVSLLWILAVLLINGIGAIDIEMFTHTTPAPGSDGGGLLNPIIGSLMMVGVATLISTPIGIFAGMYLAEYGEESRFAQITRFVTDIMLSAPSIVALRSIPISSGRRPKVVPSSQPALPCQDASP